MKRISITLTCMQLVAASAFADEIPETTTEPNATPQSGAEIKVEPISPGRALVWSLSLWSAGMLVGVPTAGCGPFVYDFLNMRAAGIAMMVGGAAIALAGIGYGASSGLLKAGHKKAFIRDGTLRVALGLIGATLFFAAYSGYSLPLPVGIAGSALFSCAAAWGLADVIRTPFVVRRERETSYRKRLNIVLAPMWGPNTAGLSMGLIL